MELVKLDLKLSHVRRKSESPAPTTRGKRNKKLARVHSVEDLEDNPLEYVEEVEKTDLMKEDYQDQIAELESKIKSLQYQRFVKLKRLKRCKLDLHSLDKQM